MKLEKGMKLDNKMLADFFGISKKSLSNSKKKKLEELEKFAQFHIEKRKVIIDEVYIEEYDKNILKDNNYNLVKNKIDEVWSDDGLDSCSRVSEVIAKDINHIISEDTVYKYTRNGRNELYGKPFGEAGSLGSCTYVWCKKNEDGSYSLLTEEEEKIKKDILTKYYGDTNEKSLIVNGMVMAGKISREEAWDVYSELINMNDKNHFLKCLLELQAVLDCKIVRGTLVERTEERVLISEL